MKKSKSILCVLFFSIGLTASLSANSNREYNYSNNLLSKEITNPKYFDWCTIDNVLTFECQDGSTITIGVDIVRYDCQTGAFISHYFFSSGETCIQPPQTPNF